jgi:hypothetical protein
MASLVDAITKPQNKYEYVPMLQSLHEIPLSISLQQADMAASFILEEKIDQKVVNLIK